MEHETWNRDGNSEGGSFCLKAGDFVVGEQNERTMLKHAGGEATHGRFGLDVKVAKHFVAAPPTDQADDICVNVGTKQRHRPGGAKGAGRDIAGEETESWA
jgi:hypothetical protein